MGKSWKRRKKRGEEELAGANTSPWLPFCFAASFFPAWESRGRSYGKKLGREERSPMVLELWGWWKGGCEKKEVTPAGLRRSERWDGGRKCN